MRSRGVLGVWVLALFAVGSAFAQEREPNNEKGQADLVKGLRIEGTIGSADDVDWFVLGGQEGTKATFTIMHAPDVDIDFEVYSDDASVGRAIGVQSGDSVTCNVPGKCFIRVWSSRGTGPYVITIQPGGGGPVAVPNSEKEPNDGKGQADLVTGLVIGGSMGSATDVDWFVLGGQEGTKATFTIMHAPDVDFDFEVYSDDNSVGKAIGVQSGDSITCDVPGKCFIRVWSSRGTGPYVITIRPGGGGGTPGGQSSEREPNDEKKLADRVGGLAITGEISTGNDMDWFVLGGQEGTKAKFTITHAPDVDFDFEVYSDDASVGRAIGIQSGDSVTCDVPGRCFVRVWSSRGTGRYTVAIQPQ